MGNVRVLLCAILLITTSFAQVSQTHPAAANIISFISDPNTDHIRLYWKDGDGNVLGSIKKLKSFIEIKNNNLIFAMNGGMYKADHTPQGLFILDKKLLTSLDTSPGTGNFYMQPNGVFYLKPNGIAGVCKSNDFVNKDIVYATQSGPMLVFDGAINSAFKKGSENLNIRNGVGILPDGKVVFAISRERINFYDFAMYFKSLGCRNALYLDGFVSRAYLPKEGFEQLDGDFGVMIAVTDK